MKASGLSRRVCTPLWRSSRGPQPLQEGGHRPSCCTCANVGTEERVSHARVLPTPRLDARPFGVQAFPSLTRLAMTTLVLALKAFPLLAIRFHLADKTRRGWTGEDLPSCDRRHTPLPDVGQASQRLSTMMGYNPRATTRATTARSWRAATSGTRSVETTLPCPV